jgi:hypothetical protein
MGDSVIRHKTLELPPILAMTREPVAACQAAHRFAADQPWRRHRRMPHRCTPPEPGTSIRRFVPLSGNRHES